MSKVFNNVAIVTHKFVTHPDDALVEYLNEEKRANVIHICHSFYDASDRKSYYSWYKKGKLFQYKETIDYKFLPEPMLYLKEVWFSFWWLFFSPLKWNLYVGMDGLCILVGNILKFFRKVAHTVYWAIDFVPKNRFENEWKNKIYHAINTHGYKNSDEMWDLSPRMAEAREKYLGLKKTDYKKIQVVPYGMYLDRIKRFSYEKCEQNTLVFMGHIKKSQGVQIVIQALPKLIRTNKKIKLKIIGTGPYIEDLKKLTKKLKVDTHCVFLGRIEKHLDVEKEIAKSVISFAPYIRKLDKWTYYADPGKVKTYLACGVPVIMTNLPWNSKEIEENKCGLIVSENPSDLLKAVQLLLQPQMNMDYRKNAIRYARSFDYGEMFRLLFK